MTKNHHKAKCYGCGTTMRGIWKFAGGIGKHGGDKMMFSHCECPKCGKILK